ncbi:MAG: hypothetical protein L0332_02245 [Chloroflexi bacterium]|nr:hypothetical protein [Chloroflexota bacterium]MCI0577538.1 hypothetical protein [Chloroflexota bacterium]MCI0645623.1 hypothetical protein [Chloroflexota bacterium]MCI0725535.1 hypothetical protein [Chloroflexota bacterium]
MPELLDNLGNLSGLLFGFILTILVFSFVIRDNFLYRLAVHLLVGVSAGYAVVVVVGEVLYPVVQNIISDPVSEGLWLFPLALGGLLFLKVFPQTAMIGNSAMAVLVAIGAAVGLVGAVAGTLFPQVIAEYTNGLIGFVAGLLTICTLFYFHFTGRLTPEGQVVLPPWQQYVGFVGRVVITITLAALFAGALSTSLVLLTERVGFYITALLG